MGRAEREVDWSEVLRRVHLARWSPDEPLRRARRLIDLRFEEDWTVVELAREAGLSREHFIRAFQRRFGTTPGRYLTTRRLEVARELLASGEASVTEACMQVGFSSLGSFSAAFRRKHGLPPSAVRRPIMVVPESIVRPPRIPTCFLRRVAGLEPRVLYRGSSTRTAVI